MFLILLSKIKPGIILNDERNNKIQLLDLVVTKKMQIYIYIYLLKRKKCCENKVLNIRNVEILNS